MDIGIVDEACAFEVVDSCGSDALWNLNKLNRRCLGDSSCTFRKAGVGDEPTARERLDSVASGKSSGSADSDGGCLLTSMSLCRRRSALLD